MKVYVVEYSFKGQDVFSPVFHEDCFKIWRHHAFALMKRLRRESALSGAGREFEYRIRPYLRVEPVPRKKKVRNK